MTKTIFSFFSGAGFLDLGFENSGFDIAYVNEFHEPFIEGYRHARTKLGLPEPRFGYDTNSIEDIDRRQLNVKIEKARAGKEIVGFIGGPPCPDFSVGGKNRGQNGENGKLSRVYVELICELLPDFFLFENVKGLYRTKRHREFFEELKSHLIDAGYCLNERLINSIEYGAPQDRDRIILIGFRDAISTKEFVWQGRSYPDRSAFDFDWPTTEPFVENETRPAPNNIPSELTVEHWFQKNCVATHPNSTHCFTPRAGKSRFESVEEGDDSRKSYKRLHRWRYSPTAAYGNNEVHLHPYKARRLTVAEALAIQSLPPEFELPASMTLSNMFKTVGNGVPYLAAYGLAQSIKNYLDNANETNCTEHRKSHRQSAA